MGNVPVNNELQRRSCWFAGCGYLAAYVQLRGSDDRDHKPLESWWATEVTFTTCSEHGTLMGWDDPALRRKHHVMTIEEFDVWEVHDE